MEKFSGCCGLLRSRAFTHRLLSSSFLGLPYRILNTTHKKELLRSLWVKLRRRELQGREAGMLHHAETSASESSFCPKSTVSKPKPQALNPKAEKFKKTQNLSPKTPNPKTSSLEPKPPKNQPPTTAFASGAGRVGVAKPPLRCLLASPDRPLGP